LFFEMNLVRASLPCGEDREAGAIPALPRNCKRGNRYQPLEGIPGRLLAKLRMPDVFDSLAS
jgi:hypothetical protein